MNHTGTARHKRFHIGLCMAGSISAGAYIAGVVDYLIEALEAWEEAKAAGHTAIPDHQVVIDLMGGSSGGGITSALLYFALRDQLKHPHLASDGRTVTADSERNILWKLWVDLNEREHGPVTHQMLRTGDIGDKYVPSGLNTFFIEDLVDVVSRYAYRLREKDRQHTPPFVNPQAELFISLFNITGIKYQYSTRGNSEGRAKHFFSEHRDLVRFCWNSTYAGDGRIPLDFATLADNLPLMLSAARATSAFPVGFRAVTMHRPAKYIWDNEFFLQKGLEKKYIKLGDDCTEGHHIYKSLHSDSGVANNEPVELTRDLLYAIQRDHYGYVEMSEQYNKLDEAQKAQEKKKLKNTTVILVDPFPARDFKIEPPGSRADNLVDWAGATIGAMNSQLLFDAKQALEAYDKNNYGLTIIEPSREQVPPDEALACAALGGFGGFLSREFRIHDFFLGRHNCQSFLRKYFVADLNEDPESADYKCVQSVIEAYRNNPAAADRFKFTVQEDGKEKTWVPIIPDVRMKKRVTTTIDPTTGATVYNDDDPLPLYQLQPLPPNALDPLQSMLKDRIQSVMTNLLDRGWQLDLFIKLGAFLGSGTIADETLTSIKAELVKRGLMEGE